jgi:hypothetical protein
MTKNEQLLTGAVIAGGLVALLVYIKTGNAIPVVPTSAVKWESK